MGTKAVARTYEAELFACKAAALLACVVIGAAGVRGLYSPASHFVGSFAQIVPLVFACVYDAKGRGEPIPPSALWLFVLAWPIALPGYWISAYGWRGVWTVLRSVLLMLTATAGSAAFAVGIMGSLR